MLDRIGKYEIRGELGKGGFGQVYLGFDPTVARLVAIKVLSAGGDASMLSRFRTEASAAGNLHHKNIVTVHDFGEDRGMFFLVMEYLAGQDLQHVIAQAGARPLIDKMRIMAQVAEGLHCAHQGGVVHRDIKPANIMLLRDGTVKIMDFGIARLTGESATRLTQTGYLIGTIAYIAPEQLRGVEADILCDIWSYGIIYYELLTGKNPFHAPDPASAMFRITSVEPEGVRSQCPACPAGLENVIARLLAKDRDSRYQSLEDVLYDTAPILLDLEKAQASELVSEANGLLAAGKLDEAQQIVRRILDLEPMHREGRALREQLQKELKYRSTRGRVDALRQKAEKAAADRNYAEAIQALGSAVQLNPTDVVLQQRLKELETAGEQNRRAQHLLAQARNELELQNFTSAFQSASEALDAEPGNPGAQELVSKLKQSIAERDSERDLREGLDKAKGLLVVDALDEAIVVLNGLAARAPENPQIGELIARTMERRDARDRESRISAGIAPARNFIRTGDFAAAVAMLENLTKEFPGESSVEGMLGYARDELQKQTKAAHSKAIGNRAWALLQEKEFENALEAVQEGLASQPENERLAHLRDVILSTRAEHNRAAAAQKALDESAALQGDGQFEAALARLEEALREQPRHPQLASAREEIRRKFEEHQRQRRAEAIQEAIANARRMVDRGAPDSATRLLQSVTAKYPNEPALSSLLDEARREAERQRLEQALNDILNRATKLEQNGNWTGALEIVEGGLPSHRFSAELSAAVTRLRAQVALERDLSAIQVQMSRQAWAEALKLLADARQRHPDETSLLDLERQSREQQRQAAIDTVCAEARRAATLPAAREILAAGLRTYGPDPKLSALQSELERREALETARELMNRGDWASAEALLRPLLRSNPSDPAARSLLEEVSRQRELELEKEREKERRRRFFENGRAEAQQAIRDCRFDDAEGRLRALLEEFPNDPVLLDELRATIEARQKHERAEAYRKGRQRASAWLTEQRFDAAIAELRKLLTEFPADPTLERDLAAAIAAKQNFEDREACEQGRRNAADLVSRRQFSTAIADLEALRARFPDDPAIAEDLKSAAGAKTLFEQRQRLDQQVQELEKLYRKGDAHGVRQQAGQLGPDPRVRELLEWADTEIARATEERARESAASLKRKRRLPILIGGGVLAAAGVAVLLWVTKPSPAAPLELSAAEISFECQVGASAPLTRIVALKSSGTPRNWTSSGADEWLSATPQTGTTPASITVSVHPAALRAGSYSGFLMFASEEKKVSLKIKVTVHEEKKPVEVTVTQPETQKTQPQTNRVQTNPAQTKPVESIAESRQTVPAQPDVPVVVRPSAAVPIPEEKTKPVPAIVDCHAPNYHGLHKGTLRWMNGSLDPNAVIALGGQIETVSGGRVSGNLLPGCDVTISSDTSGVEIVGKPSRETGFQQIRVQNKSNSPVSNIVLEWREK